MRIISSLKLAALFSSIINVRAIPVSESEAIDIQNSINNLRKGVVGSDLLPPSVHSRYVFYSIPMQNKMDKWFNTLVDGQKTNGDLCWNQADLCRSMLSTSEFSAEQAAGWAPYLYETSNQKTKVVIGVVKYRTNKQRPCFSYAACNPNTPLGFSSCFNPTVNPKLSCRNFDTFMPRLLVPELSALACTVTGRPGPFNQGKQSNSLFCFAKMARTQQDGRGDRPYLAAINGKKVCSECPDDAEKCFENLCVAQTPPTVAPTMLPTFKPTKAPTRFPTAKPTSYPTTAKPAVMPTKKRKKGKRAKHREGLGA